MLLPLVAFDAVSQAACLKPSAVSDIDARLGEAEAAWAALDGPAFDAAIDDAVLLLPCLNEPTPPAFAARYHRMMALRTWGTGDVERASWSMLAARGLDPDYSFSDELLAPGHELRLAYDQLVAAPGPTRRPARPVGGTIVFDGLGPEEPLDRTTIVQLTLADGASQTRLLRPGDPLPPYTPVPRNRNAALAVSGAVAAVGLGFYGAAWATRSQFYAEPASVGRLEDLSRRSQVYSGLAVAGVAVGAIGLTGTFVLGAR